ncbi:MAG: ferritin-like domain-containing protein [Chloroflexia bacterium]
MAHHIVSLLNEDIRGEHAAVIQYLSHAYAIGESDVACEIEAIAREEMRHLKWLAELVVQLGGDPTMERGPVDTSGETPADWMARDIVAEEQAIALYRQHVAAIEDPEVRLLLERILSDEEVHRGKFAALAGELAAEGRPAVGPIRPEQATAGPSRALEILLQGIQHEYTVILQYLYHAFTTPHCEIADELEWQAVNEMQHMGWFAEEMASRGAFPAMEHTPFDRSRDTARMLEADIAAERAVTKDYNAQIAELETAGEADLVALLSRVRDHEVYHDALFTKMLKEMGAKPAPSRPGWTVGSLQGQEQE